MSLLESSQKKSEVLEACRLRLAALPLQLTEAPDFRSRRGEKMRLTVVMGDFKSLISRITRSSRDTLPLMNKGNKEKTWRNQKKNEETYKVFALL